MAKRAKGEKVTCPRCRKERGVEELLASERALEARRRAPWWGKEGWSIEAAHRGELMWACSSCLKSERAIPACPWLQTFAHHEPHFAYFDRDETCRTCKVRYVFTALDQRHWYEQLKLWVQSSPQRCLACRRARGKKRAVSAKLTKAMTELDTRDPSSLARAAALLVANGSARKAAELLRRAKNLTKDDEKRAELIRTLESLTK